MSSLEEAMEICNIKCKYCLDRKHLWKRRDSPFAFMDGKGGFDVIRCNKCSDGRWVRCSHTLETYEGGERLLKEDDSDALRHSMIKDRANGILDTKRKALELELIRIKAAEAQALADKAAEEARVAAMKAAADAQKIAINAAAEAQVAAAIKEKEERDKATQAAKDAAAKATQEAIELAAQAAAKANEDAKQAEKAKAELERIANEKIAADKAIADKIEAEKKANEEKIEAERKLLEEVDKKMNDGSTIPKYNKHVGSKIVKTIITADVNAEVGQMIEAAKQALMVYAGDLGELLNLMKDLKFNMSVTSSEENTNQNICFECRTPKGYPIYSYFIVSTYNISCMCNCMEWVKYSDSKINVRLTYEVLFPTNNVAKDKCIELISSISSGGLGNFEKEIAKTQENAI